MMLLCVLVKRNVVLFLSHIDAALRLYCHYKSSFLWASELNSSPPILGVNSILLGWTRRSKDLHPSNGGGLVICTSQHLVSKKVKWLLLNLSTMLSITSHHSLDIDERERNENEFQQGIVFIFSVFWVFCVVVVVSLQFTSGLQLSNGAFLLPMLLTSPSHLKSSHTLSK
jgi:hypothetical protein